MYFFGIKITLNPKEGKNWNPMRFQKNQITRKLSNYSNYLWKLLNLLKNGVPEVFNKFHEDLEAPSTTATEYLYLETWTIPIQFILKFRRIIYLHYILNCNQDEMLPKVFRAQLRRPSKGDWTEIVQNDLIDFEIKLSFEEIKKTSEYSFKKKVIEACRKYTFKQLLSKQEKRRQQSENSI